MTPEAAPYHQMALNNAWANATLYSAIKDMGEAAFAAERPGFFPTLARTLNHIYEVDLYYLDALEVGGQGRAVYDREEVRDTARLAALQADADLRLARFCARIDTDLLSQTRATERKDAKPQERVDALLLHLFQHQIHHRGQAHTQVHHAGIAPPQLDDFYLEHGRAPSAQAYFS